MNSVTLIGRLAATPEVRYFESGTSVAKFRIAVDRLPKNGEKQEPDWFGCECWGKLAEVATNYLDKGKQVAVQGRIEFEHWQDKNGEKRSKPVVRVNNLELLGSSQATAESETPAVERAPLGGSATLSPVERSPQQVSRVVEQVSDVVPVVDQEDEDIPF